MEISTASITGPLRLALQVITATKAPNLEIYFELRNRFGPPQEYSIPDAQGRPAERATTRHQDIFIQFFLINIGGARAENVKLELSGDFTYRGTRSRLSDLSLFKGALIPQLAPAQLLHLFRFDEQDLYIYDPDGRRAKMKRDEFTIRMLYNGPRRCPNRILRWWAELRGRRQYESSFTFSPDILDHLDLPPGEYA